MKKIDIEVSGNFNSISWVNFLSYKHITDSLLNIILQTDSLTKSVWLTRPDSQLKVTNNGHCLPFNHQWTDIQIKKLFF